MLASVNARNYGAYYRTRAAVLCFGGWGLQTMLHLWPRLRLIQEERQILGIDRELPNLDRLTAFAAILPKTAPASGSTARSALPCLAAESRTVSGALLPGKTARVHRG